MILTGGEPPQSRPLSHRRGCTGEGGGIWEESEGVCSLLPRQRVVEFDSELMEALTHRWRHHWVETAAEKAE